MKSQVLFPKDQRLNVAFKPPKGNTYGVESINALLSWLEKYHNALEVAEGELESSGVEVIYFRVTLKDNKRIQQGMHIGTGKFEYYHLLGILKEYKTALKSAESQLSKIKI